MLVDVENVFERMKIINMIIDDFSTNRITNFGEWLVHYDDTLDEVEEFVNTYVTLVNAGKYDEIERFQKVVMLNAIALYLVEVDVEYFDIYDENDELVNKLLEYFVRTIRQYNRMLKGELKLSGQILISDIARHKFVKSEILK